MLDSKQFTTLVEMTLDAIGLGGKAAVHLIVGTAIIESNLTYLVQNHGIAISLFQIEPLSYLDLRHRLLNHMDIRQKILNYCMLTDIPEDVNCLMGNITLAIIMCRLKYFLIPAALPAADDYMGLALWHKKYYNTYLGATDISKSEAIFKSIIQENINV